jgi:isopenicillin N synthase-like dioxygenase
MNDIPLVDLTPARTRGEAGERDVSAEIDRACRDVGFFTVCGHGIDRAVFETAHAAARTFFTRPLVQKLACKPAAGVSMSDDEYTPYGYSGLLEENAYAYMGQQGKPSDYVEKFSTGRFVFDDARSDLFFPDDEEGRRLRQGLKSYFRACGELAAWLCELITIPLGHPRDYFSRHMGRSNDSLRALRYPASSQEFANDQGMAEHTDGTLVTMLTQTAPGIEVKTRGDVWIVPATRELDHFIVNIGDLLSHWTEGQYVSTGHRVLLSDHERQALVFFKLTNEDIAVKLGNMQMDALIGRQQA